MKDSQPHLQNHSNELPELFPFLIAVIGVLFIFLLITNFALISFISIFSVLPLVFTLPFMPFMYLLTVPFMSPQDLMLISNPATELPLQLMTENLLHSTMVFGTAVIAIIMLICVISYITDRQKQQQQQQAHCQNVKTDIPNTLKKAQKSPKAITPHLNHILSKSPNPLFSRKDKLDINSAHKKKLR